MTAEEPAVRRAYEKVGVADYYAISDEHALALARQIVRNLQGRKPVPPWVQAEPEPPAADPSELYGLIPEDFRHQTDAREVIARIVDGSRFDEFKERYATTVITGFARIHGFLVGIVANNGVLFSESALKVTHFVELCNPRSIPLIFLQNITGFMVGREYEPRHRATRQDRQAVANAKVPKSGIVGGRSDRHTQWADAPTSSASCGCGRTRASPDGRRAGATGLRWSATQIRKSPAKDEREGSPYYSRPGCGTTASSIILTHARSRA